MKKHAIHPFDTLHGTDTSGLIPGSVIVQGTSARVEELTAYYGVAPSILHGLLDIWLYHTNPQPIEKTVFLDIGAGKGRAMLLASQYPFLRVEGVELNEPHSRTSPAPTSPYGPTTYEPTPSLPMQPPPRRRHHKSPSPKNPLSPSSFTPLNSPSCAVFSATSLNSLSL